MSEAQERGTKWHFMDAATMAAYGPWVRHEDYAALEARATAGEEELSTAYMAGYGEGKRAAEAQLAEAVEALEWIARRDHPRNPASEVLNTQYISEQSVRELAHDSLACARAALSRLRPQSACRAPEAITPQSAARVLHACFTNPDHPLGVEAQAVYDAMTADHRETLEILGPDTHDWPSVLVAAFEVIMGERERPAKSACRARLDAAMREAEG